MNEGMIVSNSRVFFCTGGLGAVPVVIQYRAEDLRIATGFGPAVQAVEPCIGRLHVTADDAGWHWVDGSGEQFMIQGPDAYSFLFHIGLVDPTHRGIDSQTAPPRAVGR